jgi:hypothetical protein
MPVMVYGPVGRGFEGAVTLELGGVLWTGDPPPHPEASSAKQTPMASRMLTCSVIENIRSSPASDLPNPLNYMITSSTSFPRHLLAASFYSLGSKENAAKRTSGRLTTTCPPCICSTLNPPVLS